MNEQEFQNLSGTISLENSDSKQRPHLPSYTVHLFIKTDENLKFIVMILLPKFIRDWTTSFSNAPAISAEISAEIASSTSFMPFVHLILCCVDKKRQTRLHYFDKTLNVSTSNFQPLIYSR